MLTLVGQNQQNPLQLTSLLQVNADILKIIEPFTDARAEKLSTAATRQTD